MRSTSIAFRQAAYQANTGEVAVLLLTLNHDDLTQPVRVSTDNADEFVVESVTVRGTLSQGYQFIFLPMEITLPDDSEESVSQARISLDLIDRTILNSVREISSPPTITMQVVLASSPNTIEAQYTNFELTDVSADALTITGTISLGHFLSEPFPGGSFLPSTFPGLF